MSPLVVCGMSLAALALFMALGMPIAFCFAITGGAGIILLRGLDPALFTLGSAPYAWASTASLIPVPLFVLMGYLTFHSGISTDLYVAAYKWVGRLPGGLALGTTLACTAFAACSGSSLAGAATMGVVAFPEMDRYGYNRRLSTGCIAAGGTLAVLIPPSSVFIIYGFLTGTSIAKLFIAGIFPGLLLSGLFLAVIFVMCKRNPKLGPAGPSFPWREMFASLRGVWGMPALFILIIGGLYIGIFTPSEAGAIGAFGAFVITLVKRRLTISPIVAALKDSLQVICFIFTLTIGAMIYNCFLTMGGFTQMLAQWGAALPVSRYVILICILLMFIPLGMVMDALAMILLAVPILFPVIANLGFDPVHFGILLTLMTEVALITPPIGLNVYIVQGVTKVPLQDIFRGVTPFFIMLVVCVAALVAFPQISLFLPGMMK